jgi:hypothetical protein
MSRTMRPLVALAMVALISAGCSNEPVETDNGSSSGTSTSAHREKAMKFAECMRDNGIKEFPDPDSSGTLTADGVANGSSVDTTSAAWTKAIDACRDLQPAGFTGHKRNAEQQAAALKFAQCIREHGVEDFPDPSPDAPMVDTNRIPSSATNGGMTKLNAAMHTCGEVFSDGLGLGKK